MKSQLLPSFCLVGAAILISQPAFAQVIQVTQVKLNPTEDGIEVILETPAGEQLQILPRIKGNTYIADIPNAQLRLPSGNTFRRDNPVAGITSVRVISDPNSIRVIVIGSSSVPKVELFDSDEGLIFSLLPSVSSTETQGQGQNPELDTVQPGSETQQESPQAGDETPTTPQQVEPESETQADGTSSEDESIEILVTGEQETPYSAPDASTATRTDTPIRDIPQSIQVVPRQVLEDQQVTRIDEALRNVSGVTFLGNNDSRGVEFSIRGFEDAPVLRDGFRTYSFNQSFPETANFERIEVLKGPASILYGQIQPGGVVNLVSKKPLTEPFYEAELQVGNRGFVRPRFDISGPLTADGNLLYRLNGLYQHSESFRDYDTDFERFFIAPVLTWNINDRTDLTVALEYTDDQRPADFGTLAFDDGVVDVPRDRITNEPDELTTNKYFSVGYNLEHRFNENWKIKNAFRYTNYKYDYNVLALPFIFDETAGILTRFFASQEQQNKDYTFQTNVIGEFATGSINHTLLFGVDFNHSNEEGVTVGDFETPIDLNIFNPVYGLPKPDEDTLPIFFGDRTKTDRLGIYVQDQISLFDNLKLLLGLRYDTVEQETTSAQSPADGEITQSDDALTPRVGIVYQPIEEVSLYASYSQSFNPNTETTVSGDPLEPEKGEGYEVGVKAELLADRLFATLAYFDITKQNVATDDPINFGAAVATGKQQSQGVELDVVGELLPGWNIIGSYAYIDAEVTEDNNIEILGSKLPGVPRHSASLWTTYEIQSGGLQGLGFGVGFNYVGEREGDLDNSFEVDSYFLTNAAIFYRRDNWRFALNFKNLFDVNYIEGVGNSRVRGIYPGEPFTVIGSFSVQF